MIDGDIKLIDAVIKVIDEDTKEIDDNIKVLDVDIKGLDGPLNVLDMVLTLFISPYNAGGCVNFRESGNKNAQVEVLKVNRALLSPYFFLFHRRSRTRYTVLLLASSF